MNTYSFKSTIVAALLMVCGAPAYCVCSNQKPGGPPAPCNNDTPPCPPPSCDGANRFDSGTGNVNRTITDLQLFAGAGEEKLAFQRITTSRYLGAIPTPFGAGGSWRHSFYWNVYYSGTDSATGNEIIHVDYPDGTENDFYKKSTTDLYLTAGSAIQERIQQSSTDANQYNLYFPDGHRVAFYKITSGSNVSFNVQGAYDRYGEFFAFTNDSQGRVVRVTEPAGRYIQITYGSVGNYGVANVTFNYTNTSATSVSLAGTFNGWNTTATPMTQSNGVWSVTIPLQLGTSYQYKFVVNGSQWNNDSNNPNTVPPGGPSSGNNSLVTVSQGDNGLNQSAPTPVDFSYTSNSATSVAVAGDFNGWSTTANLMTNHNGTWTATINVPNGFHQYKLVVNGSQWIQDPANPFTASDGYGGYNSQVSVGYLDEAITQVSTSDGRSVSYAYSPFYVGGTIYSMLVQATYSDGSAAHYTYNTPFYGGRPLLKTVDDPRYLAGVAKPGSATRLQYTYQAAGVEGFVSTEQSLLTGAVIARINTPTTEGVRSIGAPDGSTATVNLNGAAQVTSRSDYLGRTTTYNYFSSGYGMLSSVTDALGRTTTYGRTWDFGVINSITNPDNTTRTITFTDVTKPFFPASITDELSHTTTYTRDGNGRPTRIDYPDLSYETFTYNSFGEVLTHRLRNGGTETDSYDNRGLRLTHTDPLNNVTTFTYDSHDLLASVTDALNHTTSYQYNERGLPTKITYPDGNFVSYTYDNYGNKLAMTNELGKTWSYTYDEYNRLTSITDPLNRTTQYSYGVGLSGCSSCHVDAKPTQIILPSGKTTTIAYDSQWQKTSETIGANTQDAATTTYGYDAVGNLTSVTDPLGKVWSYAYNNRNWKISATDPLNHTTQWTYDADGNNLTEKRPDNGVTTNVYDSMNRLTSTTDPKNQTTTFGYDTAGNLASLTDARSNSYAFSYDLLNRKTAMTYPGGSHENYSYDALGNLATYATRAGQVKTSTYDSRNRETAYTWSDGTPGAAKTYDAAGRLLTLNSSVSNLTYVYDNANQLLSETSLISGDGAAKTVSYSYDADGNRASLTYPGGSVISYTYTGRNQMATITADGPPPIASYTYDLNGNRISKSWENGTSASYTYDEANRLLTLDNKKGSTSFAKFDYTYNTVNDRTSRAETSGTTAAVTDSYSYDAIDQVTGVSYGSGRNVSYAYDAVGNRTSLQTNTTTTAYTTNNLNQYTQRNVELAVTNYGYDNNGNLTSANNTGGTWNYTYDAQNRLISVTGPSSVSASFSYDARNRCVKRTINGSTTYYLYDGWNLLQDRNSSDSELRRYVHGAINDEIIAMIDGNGTHFFHHDALGSTVRITNMSGNVEEGYSYDVYGAVTIKDGSGNTLSSSATGNRFLFTGREWLQDIHLYDYRNRVYSGDLGRFLQIDVIRFASGDLNNYRYGTNSVANCIDPLGQYGIWGAFGGAVIGAYGGYYSGLSNGNLSYSIISGAIAGGFIGAVTPETESLIASFAFSMLEDIAGQVTYNSLTSGSFNFDLNQAAFVAGGALFGEFAAGVDLGVRGLAELPGAEFVGKAIGAAFGSGVGSLYDGLTSGGFTGGGGSGFGSGGGSLAGHDGNFGPTGSGASPYPAPIFPIDHFRPYSPVDPLGPGNPLRPPRHHPHDCDLEPDLPAYPDWFNPTWVTYPVN